MSKAPASFPEAENLTIFPDKSQQAFYLSRIDRSVADNLKDIETSFSDDAGIVKDFIVFISKRLKQDIFGFTTFRA